MDVIIVNNTGKMFFVRLLAKPSDQSGVLYDMVFELHSKMPKKTKETLVIQAVMNGNAKKSAITNPKNKIKLSNQLDGKVNLTKGKNGKDIVFIIKSTN